MTDLPMVAAIVLPAATSGLVGWGMFNERIRGLRRELDLKANTDLVAAHYNTLKDGQAEVIARLERIETRLNGL